MARDGRRRRSRLTRQGWTLAAVALLLGAAALQRPSAALVGAFGVSVGLFFASGLVSGMAMLRMRAVRRLPDRCRVGEAVPIEYRVRNRSRVLPLCDVTITELACAGPGASPAWVDVVPPRATRRVVGWLRPSRRGALRLDTIAATSAAPIGLARKTLQWRQARTLVVTPEVVALAPGIVRGLTEHSHGGCSKGSGIGPGEDPIGLREWRRGDRARHIAWQRSTQPGHIVVVDRSMPEQPRIRIVLNLAVPTADVKSSSGDPRALEERAITLAASLASAAIDEGLECGLELIGFPGRGLPCRGGARHLVRMHRILGELDLDETRARARPTGTAHPAREIVVHPERVDHSIGGREATHLTGAQLDAIREDR